MNEYRAGYSAGRIDILRELKWILDNEKDLSIVKNIIDEKIKDWEDVEKARRIHERPEKKNLRTVCELLADRVNLCKEWLRH